MGPDRTRRTARSKAALAIGTAVTRWRGAFHHATHGASLFDVWYMDDGQFICDPANVNTALTLLDEGLERIGAPRASQVRIFGPNTTENVSKLQKDPEITDAATVCVGALTSFQVLGGPDGVH